MTGRTHDLAALTFLVATIAYLPQLPSMSLATAITAFGMNFVGGLFPDIDQPTSDFWDNFRLGPFVAKFICPMLGGHRHISHSLLGVVVVGLGLESILDIFLKFILLPIDPTVVWWAFMIGVTSHLFVDLFTKEGLPLFWPLEWKIGLPPFKSWRMTTGKVVEKAVVFPTLLLITGYVIYTHQDKFLALLHQYVGVK